MSRVRPIGSSSSSSTAEPLPISLLVRERLAAQNMTVRDLVRALPFQNRSKTVRRLEELQRGRRLPDLLAALTPALNVPPSELEEAMRRTEKLLERRACQERVEHEARAEEHYRTSFRPHAVLTTERRVPTPIFVAVLAGPERLLRLDFPDDLPPGERVSYTCEHCPERVLAFGRVSGFAINERFDRATIHARDGTLLGALPRAVRIGEGSLNGIERLPSIET